MQVRINRHECCGNGQCAEIAPDVFAVDKHHKSTILDPDAAPLELLIEAAEACPCQAITIEDNDGDCIFP
jgi:ferredoxin